MEVQPPHLRLLDPMESNPQLQIQNALLAGRWASDGSTNPCNFQHSFFQVNSNIQLVRLVREQFANAGIETHIINRRYDPISPLSKKKRKDFTDFSSYFPFLVQLIYAQENSL